MHHFLVTSCGLLKCVLLPISINYGSTVQFLQSFSYEETISCARRPYAGMHNTYKSCTWYAQQCPCNWGGDTSCSWDTSYSIIRIYHISKMLDATGIHYVAEMYHDLDVSCTWNASCTWATSRTWDASFPGYIMYLGYIMYQYASCTYKISGFRWRNG